LAAIFSSFSIAPLAGRNDPRSAGDGNSAHARAELCQACWGPHEWNEKDFTPEPSRNIQNSRLSPPRDSRIGHFAFRRCVASLSVYTPGHSWVRHMTAMKRQWFWAHAGPRFRERDLS
jgi:hypothetical protein